MNTQHIQGPMQAAIHAANILATEKQAAPVNKNTQPAVANAPAIVPRRDLLGNRILFLADTQNREAGTIQYWDGKKGSKAGTAPLEFYKSTKPIESEEDVKKLVQDFSKEFGQKEVILRQRLIKESVLARDSEGKADKTDVDAYKIKLVAAITKAIMETN